MREWIKTNKRLLLPIALVAGLLIAVVWGFLLDEPLPGKSQKAEGLVINEICTKNESILMDNDGRYRDYVELYNGGEDTNLEGFYLTDGNAKHIPFGNLPFPADSYLLVFLDQELTGFSLRADGGETVMLMDARRNVVARADTLAMTADQVMLYGESGYTISDAATPGFSNDKKGLQAFREGKVNDAPTVVISEVLSENVSSLPDERGTFSDVLELENIGQEPVFLGSFCLSDNEQNRFRYRLPGVMLDPGATLVIFCDGENYVAQSGEIHANFGIARGETLCITDRNGGFNTLPVQFPGADISLCRDSDGNYSAGSVSLGFANDEKGVADFVSSRMAENPALVISEFLPSSADVPYEGSFRDVVEIQNVSNQTISTAGWYLSDGGDPYTYALPQQELAPGAYLVILCSREETGFALSQKETLRLLAPDGKWASGVQCSSTAGQSIQRTEDGLYTTGAVNLGYENTSAGATAFTAANVPGGLRISELMSANASYLKGAYGKTCDWIELYNASAETVNLKDYALSTDSGEPNAHPLPDRQLAPGAYCVLLLSEKSITVSGYSRLPMNLSASGECVYLSRGAEIIDYAILPALSTDMAYGRENGTGGFTCLANPTPGSVNTGAVALSTQPAATAQGVYEGSVDVTLTAGGTVYYTTDCSYPTQNSTQYTAPIRLDKTTVIRAVSYEPGKQPSEVVDLTYVVNGGHALPVISLVAEPDDLWSEEKGIYATGPNASPTNPHYGANYWQNWEKKANISLFELDGTGFSLDCGLSIFGAYSRAYEKKAFSLNFRDYYGAGSLDYALFGEEGLQSYEAFILRCGGQDTFVARMRDVLITSLVADQTTVAVQKYRPVVLYINGQFWGVYYIREKANENYVAGNYNAKVEDVTLMEGNGSGSYGELVEYAHTHDLSKQEHYDYVCSQMDVENYTDFMIAQMYIANIDLENTRFFKTPDMKWTWLFYDTDLSFSNDNFNTVKDFTNPGGTGGTGAMSTKLINALLKNPEFKENFIRRMAWQMENIWSVENVTARVDEIAAMIDTDMKLDCERWGRSYDSWRGSLRYLREFPMYRNQKLPKFVQEYFGLSDAQMKEYGFAEGTK